MNELDLRAKLAIFAGTLLIVGVVLPGPMTASLAPRIRADFGFSDGQVGLAVAAYYVLSAATSLLSGRLVERIGPRLGIRAAGSVMVVTCLAIAAFAASAAALIALLVLGSVGHAISGPAVSAMLRREVPAGRQGLAFGAQQSGASLAGLAAGLALPLIAIPLGWRWAFVATALICLVAIAVAPASDGRARFQQRRRPADPSGVWLIALIAALASVAAFGFVSFLVLYSVHSGISETDAGLLLAAVGLASTAGRLLVGSVSDAPGRDALAPVAIVIALGIPGYVLLAIGSPLAIVLGALLAGGLGWSWSGALTHAAVERNPEAPARAVGVMLTGLLAGNSIGPLAIGLLAEHDAYTAAWVLCAVTALLASSLAAVATRRAANGTP